MMIHTLDQPGNPAEFWNYGYEDTIGECVDVCEAIHVLQLPKSVLENFLMTLDDSSV